MKFSGRAENKDGEDIFVAPDPGGVHQNAAGRKGFRICFKQTRAKPGTALQTPPLLIDSFTDPLVSNSFTAPPCPNG